MNSVGTFDKCQKNFLLPCKEKQSKFPPYNMKCRGKPQTHDLFRVVSRFPATFHVTSRKVDFLWDSEEWKILNVAQ